jgi:hypothetical protein
MSLKLPVLYIVACDVGNPAEIEAGLARLASTANDWDVRVFLTPAAESSLRRSGGGHLNRVIPTWIHNLGLESQISQSTSTSTPSPFPPPNAILVAPASFNIINKLAHGISDGFILDHLHPYIHRVPTVIIPVVDRGSRSRKVYRQSVKLLEKEGAAFIIPDYQDERRISEAKVAILDQNVWHRAVETLEMRHAKVLEKLHARNDSNDVPGRYFEPYECNDFHGIGGLLVALGVTIYIAHRFLDTLR